MRPHIARTLFIGCTALAIQAALQCARGQAPTLPEITVTPPKETPKAKPAPKQKAKAATQPQPSAAAPPTESAIATDTKAFNAARENLLPKIGVNYLWPEPPGHRGRPPGIERAAG